MTDTEMPGADAPETDVDDADATMLAKLLNDGQADRAGADADAAAWPEDWRARLAGADERLARRLERFQSPRAVMDSLLAAEARLRGGDKGLAADASPEALAAWRAQNGIPEAPEDYEVALPDGMLIGEEDQPLVDAFLATAHTAGMTPDQVNRTLGWYYDHVDRQMADQAEQDSIRREASAGALAKLWGARFKAHANQVNAFLGDAPEGMRESLLAARLPDGSLLADDVGILAWLGDIAARTRGAPTLTPAAQGGMASAVRDEIAKIEAYMASDRSAYFKDEKAQARYRELLEAAAPRR